jgi:hypothetical protein
VFNTAPGENQGRERRAAKIDDFDPEVPELAQLHRLSNDQIRALARGLDPETR